MMLYMLFSRSMATLTGNSKNDLVALKPIARCRDRLHIGHMTFGALWNGLACVPSRTVAVSWTIDPTLEPRVVGYMHLEQSKMLWLIDELQKTQYPMSCPHGRPIVLRYEKNEILKAFKRI